MESASSVQILVVGDVMLDAYISGEAMRISPEAPVPVVAVSGRRQLLGGAANVAVNIRSMGSRASLGGVIGADDAGGFLTKALERAGIDPSFVADTSRVTTVKTRITAGGQQIVRFDEENTTPLDPAVQQDLQRSCAVALDTAHACVISDYAKGVVSESFCRWLIAEAGKAGKPVVVDPKSKDFARYPRRNRDYTQSEGDRRSDGRFGSQLGRPESCSLTPAGGNRTVGAAGDPGR